MKTHGETFKSDKKLKKCPECEEIVNLAKIDSHISDHHFKIETVTLEFSSMEGKLNLIINFN